jgi:hypothetical protein
MHVHRPCIPTMLAAEPSCICFGGATCMFTHTPCLSTVLAAESSAHCVGGTPWQRAQPFGTVLEAALRLVHSPGRAVFNQAHPVRSVFNACTPHSHPIGAPFHQTRPLIRTSRLLLLLHGCNLLLPSLSFPLICPNNNNKCKELHLPPPLPLVCKRHQPPSKVKNILTIPCIHITLYSPVRWHCTTSAAYSPPRHSTSTRSPTTGSGSEGRLSILSCSISSLVSPLYDRGLR